MDNMDTKIMRLRRHFLNVAHFNAIARRIFKKSKAIAGRKMARQYLEYMLHVK